MDKLIITAAIVGGELTKENTPYLPVTIDEIVKEIYEVWEAGAAIVHLHVRDKEGKPSQDKEIFREIITKVKERCDIIIQVSTGGSVGMTMTERIQPVTLAPEMATVTMGTVNFGEEVFYNAKPLIREFLKTLNQYNVRPELEIFDVGMMYEAERFIKEGLLTGHLHYDFVLGVSGGMKATAENLLHLINILPKGATWSVAGIGRNQLLLTMIALPLGGHIRVGLEDNIYYNKGELATNRRLVERVVHLANILGREIATPDEAREILKIRKNK